MFKCFNPRAREGATEVTDQITRQQMVSIHAPAKARPRITRSSSCAFWFQSTRPRRRDPIVPSALIAITKFQSTRPRRRDIVSGVTVEVDICFNPRAREGATSMRSGLSKPITCFNPRAREGATLF